MSDDRVHRCMLEDIPRLTEVVGESSTRETYCTFGVDPGSAADLVRKRSSNGAYSGMTERELTVVTNGQLAGKLGWKRTVFVPSLVSQFPAPTPSSPLLNMILLPRAPS